MRRPTSASSGRLVPAIDREAGPHAAREMVQWVIDHRVDEVPGIGIDYREADGPPALFVDAYAAARRAGLKTTAHAGEFGLPAANVRCALDELRVDRIDHGYTIVDDPALARRAARVGHRLHRGADQLVLPAHACRPSAGPPSIRSAACASSACACTRTPTTRRCTT